MQGLSLPRLLMFRVNEFGRLLPVMQLLDCDKSKAAYLDNPLKRPFHMPPIRCTWTVFGQYSLPIHEALQLFYENISSMLRKL